MRLNIKIGFWSIGLWILAGCAVPTAPVGTANPTPSPQGRTTQTAAPSPTTSPIPSLAATLGKDDTPSIVINGGFEKGTNWPMAWIMDAWIYQRSGFGWEDDYPGCNGKCVSITNHEENDARWIQTIRVIPGEQYILSGRIKGVDIQGNPIGANLYVTVSDFYHTDPMGSTGTFDWKTVNLPFTGPSSGEVVIGCRLGFYGSTVTGTAYFDDISVEVDTSGRKAEPTETLPQGRVTAEAPTDADLETVPSIWTLTEFQELAGPGSKTYSVEIEQDTAWLWDCYFCTTEDKFQDFLDALEVEFRIDRAPLEVEFIRIYDRPGVKGWICRNWVTKLTNWPKDQSVFLEIFYRLSSPVSDGKDEFAAGDYSQTIVVMVTG